MKSMGTLVNAIARRRLDPAKAAASVKRETTDR
jgi:hypothetical protein